MFFQPSPEASSKSGDKQSGSLSVAIPQGLQDYWFCHDSNFFKYSKMEVPKELEGTEEHCNQLMGASTIKNCTEPKNQASKLL